MLLTAIVQALNAKPQGLDYDMLLMFAVGTAQLAFAQIGLGWTEIRDGNVEAGSPCSIAASRATGFETWQTWFGGLPMEALTALGRIDEALAEGARQAARSARNGERLFERQLDAANAGALAARH